MRNQQCAFSEIAAYMCKSDSTVRLPICHKCHVHCVRRGESPILPQQPFTNTKTASFFFFFGAVIVGRKQSALIFFAVVVIRERKINKNTVTHNPQWSPRAQHPLLKPFQHSSVTSLLLSTQLCLWSNTPDSPKQTTDTSANLSSTLGSIVV